MRFERCMLIGLMAAYTAAAAPFLVAQAPADALRRDLAALMEKDGYAQRREAILSRLKAESVELNRKGYQSYAEKKYTDAEKLFRKALDADSLNSLAAYNLACVLSLSGKGKASRMKGESIAGLKEIVAYLWRAGEGDVHWVLKLFIDSDLSGARGTDFAYSKFLPCPGDCGPDQWYDFLPDGRLLYGAGYTDLTGTAASEPQFRSEGYYAVFGDYVFAYLPERPEILSAWPSVFPEEVDDGKPPAIPPGEAFLLFQAKRDVSGASVTDLGEETDLWR